MKQYSVKYLKTLIVKDCAKRKVELKHIKESTHEYDMNVTLKCLDRIKENE
jgi:hypothetical protein